VRRLHLSLDSLQKKRVEGLSFLQGGFEDVKASLARIIEWDAFEAIGFTVHSGTAASRRRINQIITSCARSSAADRNCIALTQVIRNPANSFWRPVARSGKSPP
jgi:hypothetical protein